MQKQATKKFNLLYISSDNRASSGAFLSMVKLCSLLQKKYNINIHIILPSKGDGTPLLEKNGLKYTIIRSEDWIIPNGIKFLKLIRKLKKQLKNIIAFFKIYKIINEENIDIVHLNTVYTYTAAFAALTAKKPLIWHIREILEEGQNNKFINKPLSFWLINKATAIIAITKCVENMYPKLNKNKIKVIYNGINETTFLQKDKKILDKNCIQLICTGQIYEEKGQFDLVKACAKLKSNNINNWQLQIIGNGDIVRLQEVINQLDINEKVKILGYKPDVQNYMKDSDIAFVPSHCEAFGRVTVESMLSGCLVIAANSGGTPEIITDKQTGLLFESQNVNDLYEVIEYAISNKELSQNIATQGQQHVLTNFTATKNAETVFELYKDILGEKI